MFKCTIICLTLLLIINNLKDVRGGNSYPPNMISEDFDWNTKNHHRYLRRTIFNTALKNKNVWMMREGPPRQYFIYLKEQIKFECQNLETPNEFCMRTAERNLGDLNYNLYLTCVDIMGKFFKNQGESIITVLSDEPLEIGQNLYMYRTENDFLKLDEKHEFMEPKDFCVMIGPEEEKLIMKNRGYKWLGRNQASSSDLIDIGDYKDD